MSAAQWREAEAMEQLAGPAIETTVTYPWRLLYGLLVDEQQFDAVEQRVEQRVELWKPP